MELLKEIAPWLGAIATVLVFWFTTQREAKKEANRLQEQAATVREQSVADSAKIETLVETCSRIEEAMAHLVPKELCDTIHKGTVSASDLLTRRLKTMERRLETSVSKLDFILGHLNLHPPKGREGSDEG